MTRIIKLILSALFVTGLTATALAQSIKTPEAEDQASFRTIITKQITAFLADDGKAAFQFASPNLKTIFKTPDNFMRMVKQGYEPVYRPKQYRFSEARTLAGTPVQSVIVDGPKGFRWTAFYSFEKQKDGTWKISAVQLVKHKGAET